MHQNIIDLYEHSTIQEINESIEAIKRLAREGVQTILTYPNNDAGSDKIIAALLNLASLNLENIYIRPSLGKSLYHGLLSLARDPNIAVACLGNSSSGIKETPIFKCPAVNIGSRQDGRLRADNVIDVPHNSREIYKAIKIALEDHQFREKCKAAINPYGSGGSGVKIANTLASIEFDKNILKKLMTI